MVSAGTPKGTCSAQQEAEQVTCGSRGTAASQSMAGSTANCNALLPMAARRQPESGLGAAVGSRRMGRVPTRDVSHQHRLVTSQNSKAIIDIAVQPFATPRRSGCFLLTHSITGKNNSNGKCSLLLRALPSIRRRRQLFTANVGCSVSVSVICPATRPPACSCPTARLTMHALRLAQSESFVSTQLVFSPSYSIRSPISPLTSCRSVPSPFPRNRLCDSDRTAPPG